MNAAQPDYEMRDAVRKVLASGEWLSVTQIAKATGYSQSGIYGALNAIGAATRKHVGNANHRARQYSMGVGDLMAKWGRVT